MPNLKKDIMAKVTIVRGSDWQGMYVDGVLVIEEHRLDINLVLSELVGKKVSVVRDIVLNPMDDMILQEFGNLPELEKDLYERSRN